MEIPRHWRMRSWRYALRVEGVTQEEGEKLLRELNPWVGIAAFSKMVKDELLERHDRLERQEVLFSREAE